MVCDLSNMQRDLNWLFWINITPRYGDIGSAWYGILCEVVLHKTAESGKDASVPQNAT